MSLLRAPTFKSSNLLAEIHFIVLKIPDGSNFKGFQYQIWTPSEKIEKVVIK